MAAEQEEPLLRHASEAQPVSRFQILGQLGSGGFGAVYEALDVRSGQYVALKELGNTSGDSIARFKHEFRAVSDCHHPNLVRLQELIEQDGRWMIVMELVPGCDLMEYIRGTADEHATFDEGRLRSALTGVVEGLRALHGFGILHRDLKPSNVRVRPDGRAVLLDFGLATSVNPQHQSTHAAAVGTVRYMAPEQAAAQRVGPATDLYAVGVCLFEALTGETPFGGDNAVAIMLAKQTAEAPRASSRRKGIPDDLDELCAQLLSRLPEGRPPTDAVLLALGGGPMEGLSPLPSLSQVEFAGREPELEHLSRALSATRRGELRLMLVEGESGVGKSELVAEFLRRSSASDERLTPLRGRCYENEQVPYKAFDGCVDELAKYLRRIPEADCSALLPVRATLLGQLFPALRTLRPIARATREGIAADPTARRLEAFEALAALLGKLAEERILVLVIDDLQWADAESFRMLQALVERPEPPPLLLIATVRPREELEPSVFESIKAVRGWTCTDVISLFGLPKEQAKALAAKLLGTDAPSQWLEVMATESGGHPLFLSELVQFTQSRNLGSRANLTLEAALRARIEHLEPHARALLEIAALAARPYGPHVFARALGVPSIDEPAQRLLSAKLLRLRKGQELGCFHDRIRHTVCDLVGKARSVALHRQLAAAIAADPASDPVEQARQWDLAGEREQALLAYEVAIARAIETLAFMRAAELAGRAIELVGSGDRVTAERLNVQRAHALACAGHSDEAALLYQDAADRAQGDVRLRHQTSAAALLMLSGQTQSGYSLARSLLRELGIRLPITVTGIVLRFLWDRLMLAIEPSREHKMSGTIGPRPLVAQVLEQLAIPLRVVQPLSTLPHSMQQLRLARRLGSATDASQALASLGWAITIMRSFAHAQPLFERSRALLKHALPSAHARHAFAEGSARLMGTDLHGAKAHLQRAEELARFHLPETPWVITMIRFHLGFAWYFLGEHAQLARESEAWLVEARERHDLMGQALLEGMGYGFVRHLMADAPARALEEHDRLLAALPAEPFTFAHLGMFISKVQTLLYQGGSAALRMLDGFSRRDKPFFKTRTARGLWAAYLVESSLHAAVGAPAAEQSRLLRRATVELRFLRTSTPLLGAFAELYDAQIAALESRHERALELARIARHRNEQLRTVLRHHALYLEGALEGGDNGRKKRETALDAFRKEGWVRPLRGLQMGLSIPPELVSDDGSSRAHAKRRIGRYEVLASIRSGGQGSVVAARHLDTGRKVALKELAHGAGRSLGRFKREFRTLQELYHTNLVRVEALLEDEGRWYMVMELVEGHDLLGALRSTSKTVTSQVCRLFLGVAQGIKALHDAGFVHCDVTPTNVRVTSEGRVVLIDFGLMTRVGDVLDASGTGNPAYAAPEQQSGAPVAPSGDVYALGACLYEALFGHPPPERATQVAHVSLAATPSSGLLEACCLRMLAVEPARRPSIHEVIAAFAQTADIEGTSTVDATLGLAEDAVAFAGRERELAMLDDAFEETCDVGFTLAFVEGESGVGKSALVGEFARARMGSFPNLELLMGRCYENERVGFKAFDGAIDHLAAMLRAMPDALCEAFLPKRAALLAQLFPVLSSVPAIAAASTKGLPADPVTRKHAALDCLVSLFAHLSLRHELLFVVDDLQWADDDSFALLHAMVARRAHLPFLFVCTVRPENELDPAAAKHIASLRALASTVSVALRGLSEPAARALALAIHGAPLPEERLQALVREANGHPLFLRELVGQEKRGQGDLPASTLKLDGALRAHVASLPDDARQLLSMVALAGRPLGAHHHARAMGLAEVPREAMIILLSQGLLRRRGEDELVCYHDRIRQVAIAALEPTARQQAAAALAASLESDHASEPAERARLWEMADALDRASEAYEQAGDRELSGFGFVQAAQHYARASELSSGAAQGQDGERACRLLEQRGHALVRAGQSAEAARVYQLAATHADGDAKVRLRIGAAQHLIQSAQVEEGMRAASELLAELGLSLPTTERRALMRIAVERARIRWHGTNIQLRSIVLTDRERMQLEALHGLSSPVRAISYLPGTMLATQYLRCALKAGSPVHTARALAFEGLTRTLRAPDKDQAPLFERSRELAEGTGLPALIAEIELLRGLSYISRNDFVRAQQHLLSAHELLLTSCPGERWLLTAARMYLGFAWYYNGDLAAIPRHMGAWMDDARAADDRHAIAALSGFGWASLRHVIADRPDDAIRELEGALAPWPDEPFTTIHFGAFGAMSAVRCLAHPETALAWHDADEPRRRRAFLMRIPPGQLVDATCNLNALLHAMARASGGERAAFSTRARAEVARMRHNPSKGARGFASTYEGILLVAARDNMGALRAFRDAGDALERIGNRFFTARARYLEGVIEGGEEGQKKCAAFLQLVRAQGWKSEARGLDFWLPAFHLLTS